MPRKQYPSDKARRRQRPHAKVHLSARYHRKTAGHFDDAEFRGQFLALLMLAVDRYAAQSDGRLTLSHADIGWISGKRRADVALKSVQRLLDVLEYSHERRGEVLLTQIPKLAIKQGFATHSTTETTQTPHGYASPRRTEEQKNRRTEEQSSTASEPPAICVGLATRLRDAILSLQPARKLGTNFVSTAANIYDLTIRRDNRTANDIADQIDWLFGLDNLGAEYSFKVFSAAAHRKKFDNIDLAMSRKSRPVQTKETKNQRIDRLAQEAVNGDDSRGIF